MTVNEFHILLIDDDEDDYINLRDLFAEITRSKYKITWKSSYRAGLEALNEHHFDVCLLDYRLGEHTGIDLLNEVRTLGHLCPIILLTGHSDFDLDLQAMQMGAAEFLIKGQLTAPLLERTVRYSIKHALDMQELRESKAQILQQDRMASLGLLASSLAHEIGTPLGIIRSRAELVEKRSAINDSLKQDMGVVITQIDRITKLVQSLLNLAREKKATHAVSVDLDLVIEDILNLIKHEISRKGILLVLEVQSGLQVKAEAGPLSQVLLNLLVNSIHAIEERQATIEKTEGHQITLSTKSFADSIEISVKDTGCGIPDKNFPHLFKPFFTTKDIGLGTGLGLATSYRLVHSWSGSIFVQNSKPLGAIFTLKLEKPRK